MSKYQDALDNGENPDCPLHGVGTDWAMANPDICELLERAEAAESALRQANARIAELEGVLSAASYLINRQDAASRGAKVRDLDEAWSRYISARTKLAALHSQSEETR